MSKHKLPFELHIFQSGEHGMSVTNNLSDPSGERIDESVGLWVRLCSMWLKKLFSHNGISNTEYTEAAK